ncbi:MAG: peptidoglycan editing factor PgeF [Bacteroidales bacterium]|nr:peptidoglycan editing factor PgeF [Bacteroidales bacterium]MBN2818874.1 peptidoglycan editing factor PgeF [Bacteroidales bacterium]
MFFNLLQFEHLKNFKEINHFISTRSGGFSKGRYAELNLSFNVDDKPEYVIKNRKIVAKLLGISNAKLFFPNQCHTANIKIVDAKTSVSELEETDALLCNTPTVGIGVLAADCVPVIFFDKQKKVIGAAHAGWKGTVQLIAPKVVELMHIRFNSSPDDILIGIGPAISQEAYEIGSNVITAISGLFIGADKFLKFKNQNTEHAFVDLQMLNMQLLINHGVPAANIEVLRKCTFQSPELFFSARRDGFHCGRFGSVISII